MDYSDAAGGKWWDRRLTRWDFRIGWFPVHSVTTEDPHVFRFPDSLEVFHWHGETFDLPKGSIRLARSQACENQAFQFGKHVIGLQFHLEITPGSLRGMVDIGRDEMILGPFVEEVECVLAAPASAYEDANDCMKRLLEYWRPAGS